MTDMYPRRKGAPTIKIEKRPRRRTGDRTYADIRGRRTKDLIRDHHRLNLDDPGTLAGTRHDYWFDERFEKHHDLHGNGECGDDSEKHRCCDVKKIGAGEK